MQKQNTAPSLPYQLSQCGIPQADHVEIFPHVICPYYFDKGRAIGKVMGAGRWARNQKKSSKGKCPPKNSFKVKPKGKNHGKDGPAISLEPE